MSTINPRVQVTVDDELADALGAVDPSPASRSRLVRDMALRGARAELDERDRVKEAHAYIRRIATGEIDHDFQAVREVWEERERGY